MTREQKLAYIKAFHMGMADCSSCPLRLGTTCPAKPWSDWTQSEIWLAYEILKRRGEETIKLKEGIKPDNDEINPDNDEIETADDEVKFVKVSHEEHEAEEREQKHDSVHHPAHYCKGGIECIDVIRSVLGDKFKWYCVGNVIKYIFRAYDKNGTEDMEKAKVYLDWAIAEDKKNAE